MWLDDVRDHPDHPARKALDDLLAQLARDLQHDPDTIARAEALTVRMMAHPQIGASAVAAWDALRTALLGALADADGQLRSRGVAALSEFGERLLNDPDLQFIRINGTIVGGLAGLAIHTLNVLL